MVFALVAAHVGKDNKIALNFLLLHQSVEMSIKRTVGETVHCHVLAPFYPAVRTGSGNTPY